MRKALLRSLPAITEESLNPKTTGAWCIQCTTAPSKRQGGIFNE